jgi:hypothetical protein
MKQRKKAEDRLARPSRPLSQHISIPPPMRGILIAIAAVGIGFITLMSMPTEVKTVNIENASKALPRVSEATGKEIPRIYACHKFQQYYALAGQNPELIAMEFWKDTSQMIMARNWIDATYYVVPIDRPIDIPVPCQANTTL